MDVPQTLFQRHTAFMAHFSLSKAQRAEMNQCTGVDDTITYLSKLFNF